MDVIFSPAEANTLIFAGLLPDPRGSITCQPSRNLIMTTIQRIIDAARKTQEARGIADGGHTAGAANQELRDALAEYDAERTPEEEARRKEILEYAREHLGKDGELEFDGDALLSEGDDPGCYIQAWAWLDYTGTKWDPAKKEEPACS